MGLRERKVGDHVIYVDQYGKPRQALITIWWGDIEAYKSETGEIGCNLLFVASDVEKGDTYGRQIERETSVVHKTSQPAHGNYWCWPDEL